MGERTLEPITPKDAEEMYLEERKTAAYATREKIKDVLGVFTEWTEEDGLTNMNDIRGRQLRNFKNWCQTNSDNNTVSLNGIMGVLRRFLVFCVDIEAVYPNVPNKTPIPNVPDEAEVSDEKPNDELVEAVKEYLETHEPSSRRHVEHRLITELGDRVGAIRGIDVGDVDVEEQVIRLRHRPEKEFTDKRGTPLKNGKDGERNQNISQELAELIQRYLDNPERPDVVGEFGRKPLLTTTGGRPNITTIRRDLYKLTRPCMYTGECPHDRRKESCKATKSRFAYDCPSSHSPHPLRRWSIEHQIEKGVSKELLADRVDVSVPVLNRHYDRRSEERKRQHRLELLEKIFDGYGDPEATLDAGVLVDMFTNTDGTVDTEALMEFNTASDSTGSNTTETTSASEESETDKGESLSENQATIERFSDGFTSVFHPLYVPIITGIIVGQETVGRLQREFDMLTEKPGTSLRPSRGRIAEGAAAYSLFVGMLAFNLMSLGLTPGTIA